MADADATELQGRQGSFGGNVLGRRVTRKKTEDKRERRRLILGALASPPASYDVMRESRVIA